jgi:hypothetical protein
MARRRRPPRRDPKPLNLGGTHWRADGAAKSRFSTERDAQDAAQLRWVEDKVELNVYQCEFCKGWHMGKPFRD